MQEDDFSELDVCLFFAELDAEDLCLTIPCLEAETDGRIQRILPTNEFVPREEDPFDQLDEVGSALMMEELQSSADNHEDCE